MLALTFSVDYWDYLGWADTFAKPEFAERQKAYVAQAVAARALYAAGGGRRPRPRPRALKTDEVDDAGAPTPAKAPRDPPDMRFVGDAPRRRRLRPRARAAAPRSGWSATTRASRRWRSRRGDNRGQTIVADATWCASSMRLGAWRGRPVAYPPAGRRRGRA